MFYLQFQFVNRTLFNGIQKSQMLLFELVLFHKFDRRISLVTVAARDFGRENRITDLAQI